MKKISFDSLFNNGRFLTIFSLFFAALSWLIVSIILQPDTPRSVNNVPVTLGNQTDALLELGLNPIVDTETFVTVNVKGPSTIVGNLKPENFTVTVRLNSTVTEPATYELPLVVTNATKENLGEGVVVESIVPSTIKVRFDRLSIKTFTIEPQVRGVSVPPDYVVIDQEKVNPSKVTVSGPQADLDKIDKAIISAELTEPLTRNYAESRPIVFLDVEGKVVSSDNRHLVLDQTEAQLTVHVKKLKTLPFKVEFTNVPFEFPLEALMERMWLSNETIKVAGPVDTIDNYQDLLLGHVDLRTVDLENTDFDFTVELPNTAFTNVDNITNVLVEFDTQGLKTTGFNNVPVTTTTPPSQYKVDLLTSTIRRVNLTGEEDLLAEITTDDIVAVIDLTEKTLQPGQYSYPVKISVPTKGLVWATGEYSAIIQVSEVPQP